MPHRLLTTDARRLLDCTPGLVYVYDLDEHRDVYANPALAALLGASPDAAGAMGDRVFDALLHPDDAAAVAAHHARLAATADDRVLEVEFRLRDRGGQWVFVHCRERVFTRDADGRAKQIIGVAEDVSERRRSEAALRASEALLQETARLAKVGGWAIDLAAQTLTWTEEVYRIHEVDDPSFRPTIATASDFYAPESRPVISAAVDRALVCAEPFDLELEIVTAKGSRRVVRAIGRAEQREGKPVKVLGTFQDVTERRRAEAAIAASEERLELAARSAHLGVWDWDLVANTMVWDARMMEMYGVEPGAFSGSVEAWETGLHPDDHDRAIAECQAALQGAATYDVQFRIRRADGTVRHLEADALIVRAPDGRPIRMTGINRDITAEVEARVERERLQSQLGQAQKMESVGRLAGGIAHDFNNMLGVIIGHTEMALEETRGSPDLQADLQEIMGAAKRSADLTRQLLAFARRQTVSPKLLELDATIDETLSMLRRLIGEDVALVFQRGATGALVKIDSGQLDQILTNLCVNARDAIRGVGTIRIVTAAVTLGPGDCVDHPGCVPGPYLKLSVSDTGEGMSRDVLDHLFEPFFTTKQLGRGTGLGLATVHGIVSQNGGFIDVASELGRGTTFAIYLPRQAGVGADARAVARVADDRGDETILVVEDEAALLRLEARTLEALGYTVLPASSPAEALHMASRYAGEIHLLVSDVVMPGMNGQDLARALLAMRPRMRRLFVSGYTANLIGPAGALEDGVRLLQKPFQKQELGAAVRAALGASRA
jgi:PAS domain S-box-containing protein